jgi:glycosyltransferase involved in cell wall biosynthesis
MRFRKIIKRYYKRIKNYSEPYSDSLRIAWHKRLARYRQADIAIFHRYSPPPGGGSHQFTKALWDEFEQRGLRVELNTISATTQACIFNASIFSVDRLRKLYKESCRMVHRVDGPVGIYRGWDDGTDSLIQQLNKEFADVTIFQSHYSWRKYQEMGLVFKSPCVIKNAVNPQFFHPRGRVRFDRQRKIRLLSFSWSDNPNKGTATYKWLENHLDWDRFEYTFVGRSQIPFERLHVIPPVNSEQLASILRHHDIYVTASLHESCSNSILEALACGLPVIYVKSGSNAEVVGEAGYGFDSQEEIPELLKKLVNEYEEYQKRITLPTIADVCDRYLSVMGITS